MTISNIYVYQGDGAGPVSTEELIRSLRTKGIYPISADISYWSRMDNISSLTSLFIGGGHGPIIGGAIHRQGDVQHNIRKWLNQENHSFIGICAGAIAASSQWSQKPSDKWSGSANLFPLQLYLGKTYGPGYVGDSLPNAAQLDPFVTARAVHIMHSGEETPRAMYWNLGPHFDPVYPEQEIIASYGGEKPAAVQINYGQGRVILSGVHPEIRKTETCNPKIQQVATRYPELAEESNIQAQSQLFDEICSRAGIISDTTQHPS